jgi:hypothetical protein
MYVLQVSAQVSALGECLLTEGTFEGPLASMLPEVVSQVATLFEDTPASRVLAFEVQFHSLSFRILNANGLVPLFRNSIKGFWPGLAFRFMVILYIFHRAVFVFFPRIVGFRTFLRA